ncbi:Lrp/AsnC family transcriptional regulator [Nonomuraea sp. SYSU D8015]|uniref:Lrp/AsnC family transcriptional regulator n=1 Tax=Nonomuraea sp. SYSU D8015 TaxID=2593644 RepID=UPI001660D7E6|nr:Lrp/AsnC family transcriptional regulator [Nonomuraea sp. SYSU D8015]
MSAHSLDAINRVLLAELSRDGRKTVRALAALVGLSEPSVRDRLDKLSRDGVVAGYRVIVEPAQVGAGTAAFVALRFGSEPGVKAEVNAALEREPCVLEVHEVAGEDCYLIKVRVGTTVELADALDRVRAIPAISHTNSTVVLRTVFERPITIEAG